MRTSIKLANLVMLGLVVGCGGQEQKAPLTFEEFEAQAYKEPDSDVYVVNGDEPAEGLAGLREVYLRYRDSQDGVNRLASTEQPLIVNRVGGKDDKWVDPRVQNITYCVSTKGWSASRYSAAVAALNAAAAEWEGVANVNFVHASSLDGTGCNSRSATEFNVRQVCTGQYLARAFFPSTTRRSREILVDCTSFGNITPWTLTGVLRHELGHTIGFRHEHTRSESGVCFEDNNWRDLTPYDSSSVMHYPQCNGGNQTGDLVLTALDQAGATSLYP